MKTRIAAAALTLGVGAIALTGCVNPVEQLINNTVEDVVEGATGVDIDAGAGASVPDGFPADIPLPSGSPLVALAVDGGYTVTYTLPSAADGEAVIEQLKSRYTTDSESDFGGMKIWSFTGTDYTVGVTLLEQEDGTAQLLYVVAPLTQ